MGTKKVATSLVALTAALGLAFAAQSATAATAKISNGVVKIGVLGDMTGVYRTGFSGPGAVAAAEMAVKDFGGKVLGVPIKVVSANHQDKAGLGSTIARKWMTQQHVDMITDLTDSAVALAVQKIAAENHVITMATGPASTQLTNQQCTKYAIHYGYDTGALAVGGAAAVVKDGGKSWYFITVNYAFGHSLQKNATTVVEKLGGKVLGSAVTPLGTTDFSSYLLGAQASGAQVIALANAGDDTVNSVKQAHQFGITKHQKLVALLVLSSNIKALGLQTAQGLEFTTAWFPNESPASIKWTERYLKFSHGAAPTFPHAAIYSAVTAYLNAVKAAGTDNPDAVRAELGKMKINDFFAQGGHISPNGQLIHAMYLVKVKTPAESKRPWDLVKLVRKIPGDVAFKPVYKVTCPLVKH